jgi:ketosteroid isomerase-like protein
MSQENVRLLYRWYEAIRRNDAETCVGYARADAEIISYLMGVEGTIYHGHSGVRRYLDDVFSIFPNWHPEIVCVEDHGDVVIAEIRMAGSGASSGLEIEQTTWQLTRFREGKLAGFTAYGTRAAALEAAGLHE